jgi:hypothetical protein
MHWVTNRFDSKTASREWCRTVKEDTVARGEAHPAIADLAALRGVWSMYLSIYLFIKVDGHLAGMR